MLNHKSRHSLLLGIYRPPSYLIVYYCYLLLLTLGSVAFALDEYLATQVYALASPERKLQAIADASEDFNTNRPFDEIVGLEITRSNTPQLYNLIVNSVMDAAVSTAAAKDHYKRERPFMYNDCFSCTPLEEKGLRSSGSYPSGHAALGWAYALILTEIFPAKADEILKRGKEFGISRNICNAHWHSDVVAARTMASATVARLHANKEFIQDLQKAKAEVAKLIKNKSTIRK
jgi:acid phosphatase (class A)